MEPQIKVLLVDDHPILTEGIKTIINQAPECNVISTAINGYEALSFLVKNEIDLIVLDYELPDRSGLEILKAIRKKNEQVKIIMLSMYDEYSVIKQVLDEGANGYILKRDSHDNILSAIKKVNEGKRYLSDEVSEIILNSPEKTESKGILTRRELEIVRLIAQDMLNKEIAAELFISERTVETHRKNIYRKTNTSSAVSLLNFIRESGLLKV